MNASDLHDRGNTPKRTPDVSKASLEEHIHQIFPSSRINSNVRTMLNTKGKSVA